MTNLKNITMRAGRGDEEIAGWVYAQEIKGNTSRTFLDGISQAGAFNIVNRKTGIVWCRAFTIENDARVILA